MLPYCAGCCVTVATQNAVGDGIHAVRDVIHVVVDDTHVVGDDIYVVGDAIHAVGGAIHVHVVGDGIHTAELSQLCRCFSTVSFTLNILV